MKHKYTDEFCNFWDLAFNWRGGSKSPNDKAGAFRAWNGRLKDGHTPTDIMLGAIAYDIWLQRDGAWGTSRAKQGITFLSGEADPPHFIAALGFQATEPKPKLTFEDKKYHRPMPKPWVSSDDSNVTRLDSGDSLQKFANLRKVGGIRK